jgi:murein DD-endopeptidase MepM/ murein hydrolase activator NlpD
LPTATPAPTAPPTARPPGILEYSYPIGSPGRPPGDGFFIRHGYATENTWYNPGYWHTGEDWYAVEGDTAGAEVYAISAGEVVYAGANYPGRVVIVRHPGGLFSMYGHLDPALAVGVGRQVARGDLLGTVLFRGDETPNHLHFEVRAFLTTREVNGEAPRYGFRCGVNCPPGPGYWPIAAPDLPSDQGWRNPTHAINRRMLPEGAPGEVVVATRPVSPSVALWSAPAGEAGAQPGGDLALLPGDRYPLLEVWAGAEDTRETSAHSYRLWYRIGLADGREGWVQAAVPSAFETGSDRRPSSILFNFVPLVARHTDFTMWRWLGGGHPLQTTPAKLLWWTA